MGSPPERLALVGFSQGTMMALHVGLRGRAPLAGILGFSGVLVGAPERLKEQMQSSRRFCCPRRSRPHHPDPGHVG
jgi:phospholipase/carboxylesterase